MMAKLAQKRLESLDDDDLPVDPSNGERDCPES
jgi:hypothetical protein